MTGPARERPCGPVATPTALAPLVAGYDWARDLVGEAGAAIHRLHGKPGAPDLYLKHGREMVAEEVAGEAERLRWLAGRIAVPAVVDHARAPAEAWLLTTSVPGLTAYQVLAEESCDPAAVVDALAGFLRRLHALPVAECPFDGDRLAQARTRIDAGLVDTDGFDDARAGWTAEQIWDELTALLPLVPDRVVTHGDYSLDNILLQDGAVTGCIDVGRVGVADRYQDLAILWNCLGEFGPDLQDRLFAAYGIATPDPRRLHFHLLLDELF